MRVKEREWRHRRPGRATRRRHPFAGVLFAKKTAPDGARVCAVMEDSCRSDNGYGPMRHKRTIIHSAAEDKLASNFFINVGAAEMYSDAGHGSKIFNRLLFTSAG